MEKVIKTFGLIDAIVVIVSMCMVDSESCIPMIVCLVAVLIGCALTIYCERR